MSKIQLVIEIDEGLLERITKGKDLSEMQNSEMAYAILDGTPLPKGHGDLVDRDRVIDLLNEQEYSYYTQLDKVCDTVYEAPTIIEADGGGKDLIFRNE